MLPLHPLSALGLLARDIAAAAQVDAIALEAAAAVEVHRSVGIKRPGDLLRFAEGARRIGVSVGAAEQSKQKETEAAHGILDN